MAKTRIEWADYVWNPTVGCTPASEGCKNCYARELHNRRHAAHLAGKAMPMQYEKPFEKIQLLPERLDDPLHWAKAEYNWKRGRDSIVFVDSVSDLFHRDVPKEFIEQVWKTMEVAQHLRFVVLTKRPLHMSRVLYELFPYRFLQNVWLGVSISSMRDYFDIVHLQNIPAEKRVLSVEPMLERIMLTAHNFENIDWVICGCESGANRRPFNNDWARILRDQCVAAGVPFFFKQGWDENGKVVKMPALDGVVWDQKPEVKE